MQFESVGKSIKRTVKQLISFLLYSFIIAVLYYFAYSIFFDTVPEYFIKKENKILTEHLGDLNEKYEQLREVINDISKRDSNIYNVIFESKSMDVFLTAKSGSPEIFRNRTNEELSAYTEQKINTLNDKIHKQAIKMDSLKKLISDKKEELEFIPMTVPIKHLDINSVGVSVGSKMHPIYKSLRIHTGIDFAATAGVEVVATASGRVKNVSTKFSAGTEVIIDHGNDYETRYLYLSKVGVKRNDKIQRGDVIGRIGNIGVNMPHLHYEVRIGGRIADPLNYFFGELSPKEMILFITASLNKGQSLD
ncbi:MAG: peptidoglycan DD-metalloendopeptidase family protein [Prevotellaceae bacterium]|nr:peptidoglycan DD-metalloendopeptidase family protein [Prevotellaceae bacterium]